MEIILKLWTQKYASRPSSEFGDNPILGFSPQIIFLLKFKVAITARLKCLNIRHYKTFLNSLRSQRSNELISGS
jgi:hypothetical protein